MRRPACAGAQMIFADSLSFESLVPLALFGAFAALAWWGLDLMTTGKPRAMERLEELEDPRKRRRPAIESALKKSDALTRVLEKASPSLAKPLQPKSEAELGKLKTKLAIAGFRGESAGSIFLGLKFAGLVAGLFLGGGIITSLRGINQNSLVWSVGLAGLLFYLPDLVVGFLGSSRKQAIFLALPDALDLMVVCVEAGLGPRSGDAQSGRRNEEARTASWPRSSRCRISSCRWAGPRRSAPRTWACGPACPTCGLWRPC